MRVQNLSIVKPVNTSEINNSSGNLEAAANQGNKQPTGKKDELNLTNEKKRLEEAVEHANKAIEGSNRYFKYEIYGPGKDVVISVMDSTTDEVIREIPAKKLLDVVNNLMELAGLVVDERR